MHFSVKETDLTTLYNCFVESGRGCLLLGTHGLKGCILYAYARLIPCDTIFKKDNVNTGLSNTTVQYSRWHTVTSLPPVSTSARQSI